MKKIIAVFCCTVLMTLPAMADRIDSPNSTVEYNKSNYEYCNANPSACQGGNKTHAKKHSDVTKIVVISVAAGAVFAGAMWYIFKKAPSENNPGQVKLASF